MVSHILGTIVLSLRVKLTVAQTLVEQAFLQFFSLFFFIIYKEIDTSTTANWYT